MNEWGEGKRSELLSLGTQDSDKGLRGSLRISGKFKKGAILIPLAIGLVAFSIGANSYLNRTSDAREFPDQVAPTPTTSPPDSLDPLKIYETRIFFPDGTILLLESLKEPLTDSSGNIYGVKEALCTDARRKLPREVLVSDYGCREGLNDFFNNNLPAFGTVKSSNP